MHISNWPEISLMSILKLFVYNFVSLPKREVIIISLWNGLHSGFRFMNDNSKKEKKEKSELVYVVQ